MNEVKAPRSFKALVKRLTDVEAGKEQVNIAQMSEVLKRLIGLLKQHPLAVLKVLLDN